MFFMFALPPNTSVLCLSAATLSKASMRNSEMFHVFQLVAYAPLLEWNMIEVIGVPPTVMLRRSRTPDPAVILPSWMTPFPMSV